MPTCEFCSVIFYFFFFYENFMQLVQWIHKIAKANSIMYPGYKDRLQLTKLFLNILILGDETME